MVAQKGIFKHRNVARVALLLSLVLAREAHGAPSNDAKRRAAAAYDQGVKLFESASYADAARAFLQADTLAPSDDALSNAIVAGRRAGEHLLVARTAERVLARPSASAPLAAQAREALAEAAEHLVRLELSCAPEPCSLQLNGEAASAGTHYVLPGMHEAIATSGEASKTERLKLAPGATYVIKLSLDAPPSARPAQEYAQALPPARASSGQVRAPGPRSSRAESTKPLPPGAFYAGLAITALAAGFTTWSGLSTLDAYDELGDRPSQKDIDAVRGDIRRTDVFLAIAVGLGAATAVGGVFFVDFSQGPSAGDDQHAFSAGFKGRL